MSNSADATPEGTDTSPSEGPARRRIPATLDHLAGLSWRVGLIVVVAVSLGWVLLQLRLVVLPVFVALLAATVLRPPAAALMRRGWRPGLAAASVVGGALAVLVALVAVLAPVVTTEFEDLGDRLDDAFTEIEDWLVDGPLDLTEDQVDRYVDQGLEQVRGAGDASGIVGGLTLALEVVAGILLSVVLTFFFVKDAEPIAAWARGHLPEGERDRADRLGATAWETLGGYVRGSAIVGAVDAAVIAVGLLVLGVPLVLPLAVLTFFGAFFPLVGATVAGGVAALVALVDGGVVDALLVTGLVILVQQVDGDVLQPLVMGRVMRLHPVVILLALTAGGVLAGITGAFLAVPVTAVISNVVHEARARGADGGGRPTPSSSSARGGT